MVKLVAFFFLFVQVFQLSITLGSDLAAGNLTSTDYTNLFAFPDNEESETNESQVAETEFCHRSSYLHQAGWIPAYSVIINFPIEDFLLRQSFAEIQTPPPELV